MLTKIKPESRYVDGCKVTILGTTDDVNHCQCCGKTNLKATVAISFDDGEPEYWGTDCASKVYRFVSKKHKDILTECKEIVRKNDWKAKKARVMRVVNSYIADPRFLDELNDVKTRQFNDWVALDAKRNRYEIDGDEYRRQEKEIARISQEAQRGLRDKWFETKLREMLATGENPADLPDPENKETWQA